MRDLSAKSEELCVRFCPNGVCQGVPWMAARDEAP